MTPGDAPCPWCHAEPGCLTVTAELVVMPLGTFSLAGAGLKTTGTYRPMLSCRACGRRSVGRWEDGKHAVFTGGDD